MEPLKMTIQALGEYLKRRIKVGDSGMRPMISERTFTDQVGAACEHQRRPVNVRDDGTVEDVRSGEIWRRE